MTTQKSVDSLQFYPYEFILFYLFFILDAPFEILKFFSLNDNPKNLSDDVTADTPKRTNHILLLKETQRLITPDAFSYSNNTSCPPAGHSSIGQSIFEAIAGA